MNITSEFISTLRRFNAIATLTDMFDGGECFRVVFENKYKVIAVRQKDDELWKVNISFGGRVFCTQEILLSIIENAQEVISVDTYGLEDICYEMLDF